MGARADLDRLGQKILNEARTELYLAMHFMARPLNSLPYLCDLRTQRIGTEGEWIHFNPEFLLHLFIESPQKLHRLYLHLLLHCLFRHLYKGDDKEEVLWGLASDIHVESVLDSMEAELIRRPPGSFREESYAALRKSCEVLTAERIYRHFRENPPEIDTLLRLQQEFTKDDHSFWRMADQEEGEQPRTGSEAPEDTEAEGKNPENSPEGAPSPEKQADGDGSGEAKDPAGKPEKRPPKGRPKGRGREALSDRWKDLAEKLQGEMATLPDETGQWGSLSWQLQIQYKKYTDFRDFLRDLRVEREELRIDPDSFDYGYYHYGMSIYGNMPLLEENEYRESRKVEKLVIALDTSASCKEGLVQQFLNQTAALLGDGEQFFRKTEIHILECDDRVRRDLVLKSPDALRRYSAGFTLEGGYGTDFRPVFSHVEMLRQKGTLSDLRGLLYFTDGFGEYPGKPTDYRTAFVYPRDGIYSDEKTPDWAIRLYIG